MVKTDATAALVLAILVGSSVPSFAMTGIGCPDLPEYYRAVGTVENGPSCGMTMEQARLYLAQHPNGPDGPVVVQPAAPVVHQVHHRHHRRAIPQT